MSIKFLPVIGNLWHRALKDLSKVTQPIHYLSQEQSQTLIFIQAFNIWAIIHKWKKIQNILFRWKASFSFKKNQDFLLIYLLDANDSVSKIQPSEYDTYIEF